MKPEFNIEWMATFMALIPLRQISDWNNDADIGAFTGDVEKQYGDLFTAFKKIIMDSGLFDPAHPSPEQREAWMKNMAALEKMLEHRSTHPRNAGNKGSLH